MSIGGVPGKGCLKEASQHVATCSAPEVGDQPSPASTTLPRVVIPMAFVWYLEAGERQSHPTTVRLPS